MQTCQVTVLFDLVPIVCLRCFVWIHGVDLVEGVSVDNATPQTSTLIFETKNIHNEVILGPRWSPLLCI